MDKLGEFATQWEKFLRSLATDLGLKVKKGQWLANNFSNESVAYDGELAGNVSEEIAAKGREVFKTISGNTPLDACNEGIISYGTIAEYSRIGKILDPDEKFLIGIYQNGEDRPREDHWHEVSYSKIAEIRQLLDEPFITSGAVQGVFYNWTSGANPPFIQIRNLSSGVLVKCIYDKSLYNLIHKGMARDRTTVHVYGDIKWDRATNSIIEVMTSNIEIADSLSETEFYNLFGSMPAFTGDINTTDYIDWLRGDDE